MPKQQLPKNVIKWNWSSTVAALKSLMRWKEPQFMKKITQLTQLAVSIAKLG